MQALVDAGADIETVNNENHTLLDVFDSTDHSTYEWLERQGAVRTKPFE
jgi:hypothetical protein